MKILIVEDEKQARESLKNLIKLLTQNTTISFETGRVDEAITILNNNTVDLIFLDIELEDGSGFDVLEAFPTANFHVIFTTAFDNKALEAFRHNAMAYLLKPINPCELQHAIERVTKQLQLEYQANTSERKILFKTIDSFIRVYPSEIVRLKADGAYTHFITKDNRFIISKNLQYYHNILGEAFIRVHQSHLVQLKHIVSIKGSQLLLRNGETIPVSTRRKKGVIHALKLTNMN